MQGVLVLHNRKSNRGVSRGCSCRTVKSGGKRLETGRVHLESGSKTVRQKRAVSDTCIDGNENAQTAEVVETLNVYVVWKAMVQCLLCMWGKIWCEILVSCLHQRVQQI